MRNVFDVYGYLQVLCVIAGVACIRPTYLTKIYTWGIRWLKRQGVTAPLDISTDVHAICYNVE